MTNAIKWTRTEKVIGRSAIRTGQWVYTSDCGRYTIMQLRGGGYQVRRADGVWRRSSSEYPTLVLAKDAANLDRDPSYEPCP